VFLGAVPVLDTLSFANEGQAQEAALIEARVGDKC
jgi:hypothetical protein